MSLLTIWLLGQMVLTALSGTSGHGGGSAGLAHLSGKGNGEGDDVVTSAIEPARDATAGEGWDGAALPHLLFVALNVLAVRRQTDLDMLDLPVWVCLHETIHAVRLAVVPWLGLYLSDSMHMAIGVVVKTAYGGADGARSVGGGSRQERGGRP